MVTHGDSCHSTSWLQPPHLSNRKPPLPTPGTMHHERQGLIPWEEGDTVPVPLQYWDGGDKNRKAEKQAPDQAAIHGIFQISASFIFRGICSNLIEVSSGSMHHA